MISFLTQRDLVPAAVAVLVRHGCFIDASGEVCSEVIFPDGTVKEEIWPRVGGDAYELMLPDGYKCVARYVRYLGQYVLWYDPES